MYIVCKLLKNCFEIDEKTSVSSVQAKKLQHYTFVSTKEPFSVSTYKHILVM